MRRNPYTAQEFHAKAPPSLQVAADMALEGLSRDPSNEGYGWVKPLTRGDTTIVDLLAGSGEALVEAGGDLTKLEPTLIPEGGVVCPAGSFMMGSPEDEPGRNINETQHRMTLTRPFALGKYPVTQQLYTAVVGTNPSARQSGDDPRFPVELVSWFGAVRFCNRLSGMLGLDEVYSIGPGEKPNVSWDPMKSGFRLPTEAEWEYAARSGGDPFVYAGSDDLDEVGWYRNNSGRSVHPVGQKKPNRWGLYDMSGNVSEWVQDGYTDTPGDTDDYVNTRSFWYRVVRSGGWYADREFARVADRDYYEPSVRLLNHGFRICRTLPSMKTNPRRRR